MHDYCCMFEIIYIIGDVKCLVLQFYHTRKCIGLKSNIMMSDIIPLRIILLFIEIGKIKLYLPNNVYNFLIIN